MLGRVTVRRVKIEGVLRDYMNVMMAQQKGGY
jgi:hypothetical protein